MNKIEQIFDDYRMIAIIPYGFTNCDFLKVAVVERRVSSLYIERPPKALSPENPGYGYRIAPGKLSP